MAHQPALLYFNEATAGSEKVREALRPLGLRVLRADEPSDALGHLMDERVGLLTLDGPSLATFTERLITRTVELKDAYTRGRADRVALFAGILADEAGGVDTDRVRTAARIMDVGKAGVPEDILQARLRSDAVDEIAQGSGTRYDPDLVDVFRQAKDRLLVGA